MKRQSIFKIILSIALIIFALAYVFIEAIPSHKNVELFGYTTKDSTNLLKVTKSSYLEGSRYDISTGLNQSFYKVDFDYEAKDLNLVYAICEDKEYVYKFIFKVVPDEDRVFLVFCYKFHHDEEEGGDDLTQTKMRELVNSIF